MQRSRLENPHLLLTLGLALLLAAPATADWLVTDAGESIQTQGPWIISDDTVNYVDVEGERRTLALADVDLSASKEMTIEKKPDIILYQTSWCGYCRRARTLLTELGANFEAKDIQKDPSAAREYQQKGKGYGGVPLIDFSGEIVRGYSEQAIREHVRRIAAEKSAAQPTS